jgi:hypothetical protein
VQSNFADISRNNTSRRSSIWAKTLIGLALLPAYVLLLHHFVYLSTDAVQTHSQEFGAALGDAVLWGSAAMAGFGLLGILVTVNFPNRRPVVPAWSFAILMLLALAGIWIVTLLSISAASLADSLPPPVGPTREQRLHIRRWVIDLYLPVTLLVTLMALIQRVTARPEHRQWPWIGFALGAAPFFVTTVLLVVAISSELG